MNFSLSRWLAGVGLAFLLSSNAAARWSYPPGGSLVVPPGGAVDSVPALCTGHAGNPGLGRRPGRRFFGYVHSTAAITNGGGTLSVGGDPRDRRITECRQQHDRAARRPRSGQHQPAQRHLGRAEPDHQEQHGPHLCAACRGKYHRARDADRRGSAWSACGAAGCQRHCGAHQPGSRCDGRAYQCDGSGHRADRCWSQRVCCSNSHAERVRADASVSCSWHWRSGVSAALHWR